MRRQRLELYELPTTCRARTSTNDYGFDPHEQEHETFTGMGADINVHDQWACESMGADPGPHQGASRPVRQGDHRLSPHPALRRSMQAVKGERAADGAGSGAGACASPGRSASTASARPPTGRATGESARASPQAQELGEAGRLGSRQRVPSCPPALTCTPRSSFVERHDLWSDEQRTARTRQSKSRSRQARSGALLVRRPARRAARQDHGGDRRPRS